MNGSFFIFDADELVGFIKALQTRTQEQILAGGAPMAEKMEAQAKRDAPWIDRTGKARATLAGINTFDEKGETYCIGVCGNQPYSPELEYNYNRRYAILMPVLRKYQNDLLDNIRNIISRQEGLS